jgi:hypothetical protein
MTAIKIVILVLALESIGLLYVSNDINEINKKTDQILINVGIQP